MVVLHYSTSLVIKFCDVRSLSSRPNVSSLVLRLCFLNFDLDFLLVVHIQSLLLFDVLLSDVLLFDVLLSALDSSLSCELDDARPCKPLRLPPLGPVGIIFLPWHKAYSKTREVVIIMMNIMYNNIDNGYKPWPIDMLYWPNIFF